MSDIFPQEIWKKIIKHINDFNTWCIVRFVSRTWCTWIYALDGEKLNEFTMRFHNGKHEWQELPNGMIHNYHYIKSIEKYYLGKKCDISEYLISYEKVLNDTHTVWTDKQFHLYKNEKLYLAILLLTCEKFGNQEDYTVYCPEQGLAICLGPKNNNDIYINGNFI